MFAASKTASVSGGYQISRSLRFNSADSTYLNRTLTTPTDNKKFTMSLWVKKTKNGTGDLYLLSTDASTGIIFRDDTILYLNASGNATTSAVFRDPSAWYHIVFVFDSANATANDRMIIYVNNVRQSLSTNTPPSLNATGTINSAVPHYLASYFGSATFFNGYMTEIYFIDGQALTPSSFGETNAQTGVWQPKAYSGSYGTNGFYLNFSDNSNTTAATLGKDYSGNGNNWTPNNFSVTAGAGNDSLVDSPTSYGTDTGVGGTVRGNYCTLNPLYGNPAPTNGNLDVTVSSQTVYGTMSFTTGKWYWEVTPTASLSTAYIGVMDSTYIKTDASWGTATTATYVSDGTKYGIGGPGAYGASYTNNDVIGVALDLDAGTIIFYKNGVSQGTAFTGMTGREWRPMLYAGAGTYVCNFGQRPFAYTAPSGYKALCTQNLPTPTIGATTATQAGKFFNPILYTGTGATLSVTGAGFQPDFTWIKQRNGARNHNLYDAVRGVLKVLQANVTDAEVNYSGSLTSFDSDGFSLGTASDVNINGNTYVGWNWKANGSGSSNTAGSITSTVSANTTSGFSVVTFTTQASGTATVGHGLGVAPAFIITKLRGAANNWNSYHVSLGNTVSINLNQTDAAFTGSTNWNSTSPTSSVFSLGSNWAGSYPTVAYCFAEVSGYSKFGSYVGNGSADGPFVYCGFRPAYVMIKGTASGRYWLVKDKLRAANYNPQDGNLYPNDSLAEDTTASAYIDFLSNGFKIRGTYVSSNYSGDTFIFAAFAEVPLKFSLAR